ncbi:palmitoyltransferase ZDHHC19 isoform X2 [Monodelphis domestica]|uniref:Palmitoyltransferase n=1 Tax=Monodelphis domestica TaxID=13616 RepID=F6XC56_MONDO|nr:palmitoyltransferase ZDHHC19 isoform X2 [Monodelphis domestica]
MHPRRESVPQRNELHSWAPSSIFAAFNVMLLITISGLFFSFPCRWLAQHGDWVSPTINGFLFVLTLVSLIFLNFSDPGILHRGSEWQCPLAIKVVWVNRRAFRLQWCQRCRYHRPPRTYHCPRCNICVEDFDHHCKWVNNCIGQRNFRCFLLLVVSLCLYTGALLCSCLIFLIRTSQQPFTLDKAFAVVAAIPATAFLLPLLLLLGTQALSVSSAERSYEGKCHYLQGYNPFDLGCVSNWYLTLCAPLGPKYMADAVQLQRVVEPDRTQKPRLCASHWHSCPFPVPYCHVTNVSCPYSVPVPGIHPTGGVPGLCPTNMPGPHPANVPGSHPVPVAPPLFHMKLWRSGRGPLGGGKAASLQKLQSVDVLTQVKESQRQVLRSLPPPGASPSQGAPPCQDHPSQGSLP